jgi:HEAT repeat protein
MRAAAAAWLLVAGCPRGGGPAVAIDDAGLADGAAGASEPAAVVLDARQDPSEARRARAWSVPTSADAATELAAGLKDPSPWVQAAVVRALDALGGDAADGALAACADDEVVDPFVRAEAALAAGAAGADAMARAWQHATTGAALPLTAAAARTGDGTARAALGSMLATGDLPLEPAFFAWLSAAPDPEVAHALAVAQEHAEDELATIVAAARLRLGDDTAVPVLRKALEQPDEELRLEVLDELVSIPGPAADDLVARATRDGSEFVAAYAGLVAASRAGRDRSAFADGAASADWELRQLAVRLAVVGTDPARPERTAEKVVRGGLADPSAAVRAEAATAVATAGWVGFDAELRALVADPSPEVSLAAALALLRTRRAAQ